MSKGENAVQSRWTAPSHPTTIATVLAFSVVFGLYLAEGRK